MLNARLSHVGLGIADVDATRRFYEDRVGLRLTETTADDRHRLGLGLGAHVLELAPGHGFDHFGLEITGDGEIEALASRLANQRIATEWIEPRGDHPRALSFRDPDGHRVELHGRVDRSGEGRAGHRRPVRMHHITLSTPDVLALADFYVSTLGFVVSDRMGDVFIWLRCNREHHTVA